MSSPHPKMEPSPSVSWSLQGLWVVVCGVKQLLGEGKTLPACFRDCEELVHVCLACFRKTARPGLEGSVLRAPLPALEQRISLGLCTPGEGAMVQQWPAWSTLEREPLCFSVSEAATAGTIDRGRWCRVGLRQSCGPREPFSLGGT